MADCCWCGCPSQADDVADERDIIDGKGIDYGAPAFCCIMEQETERACEALEASDAPDEVLAAAALFYWPELLADLPLTRQPLTHDRPFSGEVMHG